MFQIPVSDQMMNYTRTYMPNNPQSTSRLPHILFSHEMLVNSMH